MNNKKLEAACVIAYNVCVGTAQCLGKEPRPDWPAAHPLIRHAFMEEARWVFEGKAAGDPEKLHELRLAKLKAHGWKYGRTMDAEQKKHPFCIEWEKLSDDLKKETAMFLITIGSIRNVFGWSA